MTEKEVLFELEVWLKREADHAQQQKTIVGDDYSSLEFAAEAFAYRKVLEELERLKGYLTRLK